ncbi:MAG TPA: type III pantothenate kinase [Nocardioides sp.]|nr:type III pantothenate kinase [Nocardioides sp.]
MGVLAVDIGNSHTVLGILNDGVVGGHWLVKTDHRRTSDEWAVLLRGLIGDELDGLEGVVVCATVPSVLAEWRAMLHRHFSTIPSVILEPGVRTGLPIQVDNPREVGTDRIANALAAAVQYGGPAIVVDFGGTATTFDVVAASGAYVGGIIAPGIEVAAEALSRAGAQLRRVEITRPKGVLGKNTVEAVQAGLVYGVAAQVDGLVARLIAELGADTDVVTVISTGYLADVARELCTSFTAHVPYLGLQGLELIFRRNSA